MSIFKRKQLKGIVLHHSGTEQGNAASFKKYHISIGYKDIGYHFVILKNGNIEIGRSLSENGAHCRGNNNTIGICLVGILENKAPTPEQYKSLVRLLTDLCFVYNFNPFGTYINKGKTGGIISGHLDWCQTDCPGSKFYEMLPRIRDDVKWQLIDKVKNIGKVSRRES